MSRAAFAALAAGVAFVASGATRLGGGYYWDPATIVDYLSIALFSAALSASGAAYLALARAAGGTASRVAALIGATGGSSVRPPTSARTGFASPRSEHGSSPECCPGASAAWRSD